MNCPKCNKPLKEKTDKVMYSYWECSKCRFRLVIGAYTMINPKPIVKLKQHKKKHIKVLNPSRRDDYEERKGE